MPLNARRRNLCTARVPGQWGGRPHDAAYRSPRPLGGVTSGWIIALGTLLLLTTLGLAIGITALGDPRTADSATASGLGMGASLWGPSPS